jgi:hypothetical protein
MYSSFELLLGIDACFDLVENQLPLRSQIFVIIYFLY